MSTIDLRYGNALDLFQTVENESIDLIIADPPYNLGKNYGNNQDKKGFSPRHDDILFFNKSNKFVFNLDDVRVPQKYYRARNNMRGANPGDVWEFSHVHYSNPNRQKHPTQKPEGLIERMVLSSSHPGGLVLDPFSGSGTTLRVCQQLGRNAMGFEINPAYIEMSHKRFAMPFTGFDSVDPRMERIPNDLRKPDIRQEYLANHIKWFLENHENAIEAFQKAVKEKYGEELDASCTQESQKMPLSRQSHFSPHSSY